MRGWRVLGWLMPSILAIAALLAGVLLYASHSEQGTRSLWRMALMLSGGRLSGTLDGGTLARGMQVQQLAWRAKGEHITIDRIDGQWGFVRKPWRLKVDWLRLGTVDAYVAPTPKTAKTPHLPSLPKKLVLPFAFEILELRVDRLRLHQTPPNTPQIAAVTGKASAAVMGFRELAVRARSDRDHHQLTVEQLITPVGELKGAFQLDAQPPFALTGAAHFLSRPQPNSVWPIQHVHLRLSGSLEQMMIDVDALGAKLASHARIDITQPFAASSEDAATLKFELYDSVYADLPLTGSGMVQLGAERILLNSVQLSIAGNTTVWQGRLGQPGDQLLFELNAPHLERLAAFYAGLSGRLTAEGHLSGHFAKPKIIASYQAASLGVGHTRIEQASGQIEMHEEANSALVLNLDGRNLVMPGVTMQTLKARVAGTRERHRFTAHAVGQASKRPFDLSMAAQGSLPSTLAKMSWHGTLTQFENRGPQINLAAGLPILRLAAPVALSIEPKRFSLGAMQLEIEQAMLDLRALVYEPGLIRSAGTLKGIDAGCLLRLEQALTGKMGAFKTDLVLDGAWDFSLGERATGYLQLMRRTGDVRLNASRKFTALGLDLLSARVDLSGRRQAHLKLRAHAARLGAVEANLQSALSLNQGQVSIAPKAPLSGRIAVSLPSLKTMSALLGPQYVFEGRLAMDLTLAGQIGKPKLSGLLSGDDLAANLLDDEIALTRGIVRIALSDNQVDFRQVKFHGVEGSLQILGSIALDHVNPALSAKIVADKFKLFATPDKQLSLSGQAVLANHDAAGGLAINGDFKIDHALFDLPATPAPKLGDDVMVIRANDELAGAALNLVAPERERSAGGFLPAAKINIDLGRDFRFHGAGADLKLRGNLSVSSEFKQALHAVGDIRVAQGSTYEAFGRKLAIENGYFGFNGPIANPSINVLAMRRNQEVEVGVQVSGTLRMPNARLVSEPNLPDSEKISWLLFGHGSSDSMNLGETNTTAAAFALLGGVGGKRIAQTIGLDEFSIGQSEAGLTDPQVAKLAKALNERFVLGYEQGLTTAASIFKATWQFSRSWALTAHTGTLNGIDLLFNRRFD